MSYHKRFKVGSLIPIIKWLITYSRQNETDISLNKHNFNMLQHRTTLHLLGNFWS